MHPETHRRGLELKVPPLLTGCIAAALTWLISKTLPQFQVSVPARNLLAGSVSIVGGIVGAVGVYSFRRARTTVNPMKPASTTCLVMSGIYRISRNPMYLGFFLLLTGLAIFLSNVIAIVILPLFILYMNRFQIEPEERVLTYLFGQEFVDYKLRVRRWL